MKHTSYIVILKIFFCITVCILYLNTNAQDSIPGLSTQPHWFIPIYFEDGSGQKDTIYMGYDERAEFNGGGGVDTLFSLLDSVTNEMGGFAWDLYGCKGVKTSISKFYNDISASVSFCNTTFPFTIKWDASKLYTTLLDSTVYPNAGIDTPRIKIEVEAAGGNVQPFYNNNYFIYLADSIEADGYSHFKDSVVVGQELAGYSVDTYTGLFMNIIATKPNLSSVNTLIKDSNLFRITPNPINNYFSIKIDQINIKNAKIFNLQGQMVKQLKNGFDKIDVSNLNAGVYFLQIETKKQTFINKILKN